MNIFANSWLHNTTSFLHVLKTVFVVVIVEEFLSSFVSKTKRKAGRIKRNVRVKFLCPISWNMFSEGILIWALERERTTYSNTHSHLHTYTNSLSLTSNTLFLFLLLHNYIIFNVPFFSSFFFCTCVSLWCSIYFSFGRLQNTWMCVEDSLMHYHTYVWEKGGNEESEFLLHYDKKKCDDDIVVMGIETYKMQ